MALSGPFHLPGEFERSLQRRTKCGVGERLQAGSDEHPSAGGARLNGCMACRCEAIRGGAGRSVRACRDGDFPSRRKCRLGRAVYCVVLTPSGPVGGCDAVEGCDPQRLLLSDSPQRVAHASSVIPMFCPRKGQNCAVSARFRDPLPSRNDPRIDMAQSPACPKRGHLTRQRSRHCSSEPHAVQTVPAVPVVRPSRSTRSRKRTNVRDVSSSGSSMRS
jgi:hypothetical protein